MKIMAFNGSPRKNGNTAKILEKVLDGAADRGAETELIQLYDVDFKGCKSCFACKMLKSKSYGKCAQKDALAPIIERALEADALIFGSPVYFGDVTGEMRSFFERLVYPYFAYDSEKRSLWPKKCTAAFIYTMGALDDSIYSQFFSRSHETISKLVFNDVLRLSVTGTKHLEDYSIIHCPAIDVKSKGTHFSSDLEKAYELGVRLAEG